MVEASLHSYFNWHLYTQTIDQGYMYGYFDLKDNITIYLYVKNNIEVKNCVPIYLHDYVYQAIPGEELHDFEGKELYHNTLNTLGFENYKLYKLFITPTFLEELKGEN